MPAFSFSVPLCSLNVICLFPYPGAFVKEFNKKYRNLFYDSGLEAVLAKAGHFCVIVFGRAGFRSGGLRGPVAVLEQKRAFKPPECRGQIPRAAPGAPRICDKGAVRRKPYICRFATGETIMAGSVNKVILVGNLGRDPEVRR